MTKDEQIDFLFKQRDRLVWLLARDYPSHRCRARADDLSEFRDVVCVHLPTGQVMYHVSPAAASGLFASLPLKDNDWDGHGPDERNMRLALLGAMK